jgi:hypothetical protein
LCPAPFAKIFRFASDPNHFYIHQCPVPLEGRFAVVTDAGRDAVDAGGAADESAGPRTAKSYGPDASTLAFKFAELFSQATVTKKPDHRGERGGNR